MKLRFAALALLALAGPALAAGPAKIARAFAADFAIPRFKAVAAAAHAQADAWTRACADPAHADTAALKSAYNDTADAWAKVEFVRIGPAATALRADRFNWWLDRTGATAKALNAMLAAPNDLAPDALAKMSVAGQGLPVLERLLYDATPLDAERCAVGTAVARGQAAIADAIVSDWTGPSGAAAALTADTRWNMSFADAKEAASVMLTDLAAGLEGLKDLKVGMVFHDAMNPQAIRMAEDWRSRRTLRDIALNLAAIREAAALFMADAPKAARARLDMAFDDAEHRLNVGDPKSMLAAFTALSQTAIAVFPEATGLTLGFNNLDGD
jgi:predicted lipoprotein